jgi:folate-binding protein YgfZ
VAEESGQPAFAEVLRIWQGRPAMGAELDASTIPAAAGVVDMSVDFTKGCYVGQELVARVDSRGNNTPTNLHRLEAEAGSALVAGQELFEASADGGSDVSAAQSVGRVTSAATWPADGRVVGLGYVKRTLTPPVNLATSDGVVVQALA